MGASSLHDSDYFLACYIAASNVIARQVIHKQKVIRDEYGKPDLRSHFATMVIVSQFSLIANKALHSFVESLVQLRSSVLPPLGIGVNGPELPVSS